MLRVYASRIVTHGYECNQRIAVAVGRRTSVAVPYDVRRRRTLNVEPLPLRTNTDPRPPPMHP